MRPAIDAVDDSERRYFSIYFMPKVRNSTKDGNFKENLLSWDSICVNARAASSKSSSLLYTIYINDTSLS